MTFRLRWCAWTCAAALAACAPRFDWREVRADDALAGWFPCKVERHERAVPLAGATLPMRMVSCSAGGQLFAIGRVEAGDEPRRTQVIEGLRRALVDNLGGSVEEAPPALTARIAGEAAHAGAVALQVRGRRADGEAVTAHSRLFVRDGQVYQASVVGPELDAAASDTFFGSLRLAP